MVFSLIIVVTLKYANGSEDSNQKKGLISKAPTDF